MALDNTQIGMTAERCDEILDSAVDVIKRYGMIVPAIFFVEMNKPLSFIASQALHFFTPIVGALFDEKKIEEFATVLEDRANVERFLQKIEKAAEESDR